jgi:2-polyprenyl-6-hydroxyphenyl methylase/3-demethylubiquinone-9 3-methyltransferase
MSLRIDPEKNEIRALKQITHWRDKRVLEIGCGSGRLTLRLAGLGANVEALDPGRKLIAAARKQLPARYSKQIRYTVGKAEGLKYSNESFELAVFAWAL